MTEKIEQLADADGRRTANMAVKLLGEHPDLREVANGNA